MYPLSRRQFTAGLSSVVLGSFAPARAQSPAGRVAIVDSIHNAADPQPARAKSPDGRIAIVDTVGNTAEPEWLKLLRDQNVTTVARYYSRAKNVNNTKRMAFNSIDGELEPTILLREIFSIISIYQYFNNTREKFVNGLPDTRSPEAEATADADAAFQQAELVKQPKGTVIYFGLDLNVTANDGALVKAAVQYFRVIKNSKVGDNYELGVYGNGFISRLLIDQEKLAKYSWISASRNHDETAKYISGGDWHLFQNQVDRRWAVTNNRPGGFDIDTNIQNPRHEYIGAWNAKGPTSIDRPRTQAIFEQRRFARCIAPVYRGPNLQSGLIEKKRCILGLVPATNTRQWIWVPERAIECGNNARILWETSDGEWLHVDIDDDGAADGYCRKSHLTTDFKRMPNYMPRSC